MKTVDQAKQELDALRKEYEKLGKKVDKAHKIWENLEKKKNKDQMGIEWLVNNPTAPGQHENLQKYMNDNYGGRFEGVLAMGYTHDGNYKNPEQSFELSLADYEGGNKDKYKQNVLKFLEEVFPHVKRVLEVESRWNDKFPPMYVKALRYKSKESGISYLLFNPETKEWFKGTLGYGRWDVEYKFKDFDDAFETAFYDSNTETGNYDED